MTRLGPARAAASAPHAPEAEPSTCPWRLGQLHEHLLHVVDVVALFSGPLGVVQAVGEPGGDELEPGLVEGVAGCGDLGDDVAAFAAVEEHLLDAPDLALHA